MFSITVKLMKKSARMLIPAGIAILIGTAFIAATFLFGNAMNDSLARQTTAQLGGANYVISVDSSEGLNEQERNDIYTRTVNDPTRPYPRHRRCQGCARRILEFRNRGQWR